MSTSSRNQHDGCDGEPADASAAASETDWRGPGEIPGSRDAPGSGAHAFRQPTSGGQIPGELREWDQEAPATDPRSGERRGSGRTGSRQPGGDDR
jgi:hypothetical protein